MREVPKLCGSRLPKSTASTPSSRWRPLETRGPPAGGTIEPPVVLAQEPDPVNQAEAATVFGPRTLWIDLSGEFRADPKRAHLHQDPSQQPDLASHLYHTWKVPVPALSYVHGHSGTPLVGLSV